MFRLPVFGILLTAVLLSLPGPAGASFAVTEYAPILSRLYKDKQSPLASSYRISFDKSKSSAPCLTAYTLTGTAAELIRYDCTRLPADNIFSRSRSENDGSLKELAAVFNGLRHNNDDKPALPWSTTERSTKFTPTSSTTPPARLSDKASFITGDSSKNLTATSSAAASTIAIPNGRSPPVPPWSTPPPAAFPWSMST